MKAETGDYLAKARAVLAGAQQIAALPLPHVATREAYLAVFHAAEAYIFEQTDKVAKTHRAYAVSLLGLPRLNLASAAIWSRFCPRLISSRHGPITP